MEENNQEQKYDHRHENCFLCHHPVMKHICVGLLTFLGAFAAFYVVTDWHYKRMLDPVFQMRKMDRIMQKEARQMHKMIDRDAHKGMMLEHKASQLVHIEKGSDAYKIIINLKPFDNNEKNVEVTREDNKLTINAAGETKKHNKEAIIRFTQSFIFPEEADLDELSKFREGDRYIIVVPIGVD